VLDIVAREILRFACPPTEILRRVFSFALFFALFSAAQRLLSPTTLNRQTKSIAINP